MSYVKECEICGKEFDPEFRVIEHLCEICEQTERETRRKQADELLRKGDIPVKWLLKAGRASSSSDYAVKYYYNKKHPKFYKQKRELLRSVRRAWHENAFNHRERIEAAILDHNEHA